MNVVSWLESIEPSASDDSAHPRLCDTRKGKRKRRQVPSPSPSVAGMNAAATPPTKRPRPNNDDGNSELERTPTGHSNAWSTESSRSSASRISATKRLAKLEVTRSPVHITQISQNDGRIPLELKTILRHLDSFQQRVGIVPAHLMAEVQARAKIDDDFFNFTPWTFASGTADDTLLSSSPAPSLCEVLKVFDSAKECLNEDHAESTWNALVHWPVFELALGPIADTIRATNSLGPGDESVVLRQTREQIRIRGMPCTAARLTDRPHGSKMVDYCIFVEPRPHEAGRIADVREKLGLTYINHTDYHALRKRPIILSAESKRPGEGSRNAQLQLSVWQAAQWAFIEKLLAFRWTTEENAERPPIIPFLPALIIQGHEWHFAATTRSNNETTLWIKQPIGTTESLLGIFQIIHSLHHVTAWIGNTYWPWYRRAILQLSEEETPSIP